MKKFRSNTTIFACLFFTCLSSIYGFVPSNNQIHIESTVKKMMYAPIPDWVLEDWEKRTTASGTWIADNTNYQSEQEPYDAYALQWTYGVGNKHLKGRLYFMKDGEDLGTVWQFTEYWDPVQSELKIIQIGSDGTIGKGKIWRTEDGKIKEMQNFVAPDGSSFSSGHISWMENGINHIESFSVRGKEWTKLRYYKWELKKEEKVTIPEEYRQIAYLIGEWEVPLGENKARMTFAWGKNNRTILYKNEYRPAKLNKWVQENEGLITYNGMKDALVFITSYSDIGSPLMATGEFRFEEDGTIYREFFCHYQEGAGLPWSNGAKAPKGGTSLEFKQIWSPTGNNSFTGEFLWKKNGRWEHPIDSKLEVWSRVLQ